MRSKTLACFAVAGMVAITGCNGEDQRGTAPGATEQPGAPPATDVGPGQTPTTGPGMAPVAPGTTAPGTMPGTMPGAMPHDTMPHDTMMMHPGTPGATPGTTNP
jgi:hypothetical protein